jgi:magnesium transporter
VVGLANVELIAKLGEEFELHRLALEDVVNVHQRPKAEEFEDHIFIVTRMLLSDSPDDSEQISLFIGEGYLLTFQEREGDCFEPVRKRLRDGRGRIRSSPPDYLCYALIDAIIDGYFPVLEHYGERLEDIEDAVVTDPEPEHVQVLHDLKRELLLVRRSVWPLREMINAIIRDEHKLFTEPTRVYLRDCYDHVIQLIDIIETYREIASGLIDVYISSVGAKMNEIMKVLTIIATIFIPLGFMAGLYGMNFDSSVSPWNMPELHTRYGYPIALLAMVLIGGGMLYYFWRKGWIGSGRRRRGHRHG